MRRARVAFAVFAVLLLNGCVFIARSSVSSSGSQANDASLGVVSTSGDGRYVAFESDATNLVAGDTNGNRDVFVRDHQTGATERVSVDSTGAQASGFSFSASISDDGRYVAFLSNATDLVAGDTNDVFDVFVHDRTTGATERVSVDSTGVEADFHSFDFPPSISADGRYVAFYSQASNLVAGDTIGGDIFVHDRTTGATERVSVDSTGTQSNSSSFGRPSISGDGRYVAFVSTASNLVTGDTNDTYDVFVHDRTTGATERVSVDSTGTQANSVSEYPSISGDGRYVAFSSFATNLVGGDTNGTVDVFVRDRTAGTIERVSISTAGTQSTSVGAFAFPSISADGRYVAFQSEASSLVSGDTNGQHDVFVRDRTNGVTQRVSLSGSYQQANSFSWFPSISDDGRFVAFPSDAGNLVSGDTNGVPDVFLKFALAPRPLGTTGSTTIAPGTTADITLTGSWFDPSLLQVNDGNGFTIDQVTVANPNTSAVVTITVAADATPGSRHLVVRNPGNAWNPNVGGTDICAGCLNVS